MHLGRFVLNLSLAIVWGVLVLLWVGYHTDHLSVITSFLGLGGAFAWIAFLVGLVSEERKEGIQAQVDAGLSSHRATVVILLAYPVSWGVGACFGSLSLESAADDRDRSLTVRADGAAEAAPEDDPLRARSRRKVALWAGFLGSRDWHVKVEGLPELTGTVRGARQRKLFVPKDFARPALLLRPHPVVTQSAQGSDLVLEVSVNGKKVGQDLRPYKGESVWIGCESDVAIPASLREKWRLYLEASGTPEVVMIPWIQPSTAGEDVRVKDGDRVDVVVKRQGLQKAWCEGSFAVRYVRWEDFPQEVVLEKPPT